MQTCMTFPPLYGVFMGSAKRLGGPRTPPFGSPTGYNWEGGSRVRPSEDSRIPCREEKRAPLCVDV